VKAESNDQSFGDDFDKLLDEIRTELESSYAVHFASLKVQLFRPANSESSFHMQPYFYEESAKAGRWRQFGDSSNAR
jgi:hypothetical protein